MHGRLRTLFCRSHFRWNCSWRCAYYIIMYICVFTCDAFKQPVRACKVQAQTESLNLTKSIERIILLLEIRAQAITYVVCMLSFQLSLLHLLDYLCILETGRA